MATLTIYATGNNGYIQSSNATYATARTGGTLTANSTSSIMYIGQSTGYNCRELFLEYDTSVLGATATVSAVVENLYPQSNNTTTDYTEEVRAYDWGGGTLTTADWVSGANLDSYTLLSSISTSVVGIGAYVPFPTSAAFVTAINKTGYTRLMHNSSRHRAGNTPTNDEYMVWYSTRYDGTTTLDPYLTITYTPPVTYGAVDFNGAGDIVATGRVINAELYFINDPTVTVRAPVATHVTVTSPTNSYTAVISPTPSEATKIERNVSIDTGDATVCQSVAEELLNRWGREQISVSGVIPLDVRLRFMEKIHIKIPSAGIDEPLTLQRKEHDVFAGTTSIVCGDIILDDNELIARMLQDLINK